MRLCERLAQVSRCRVLDIGPVDLPCDARTTMLLKILVVDDSMSVRNLIWMALVSAGHKVTIAADGEEAMAKVKNDPPDLIVTDLVMPRLDGLGFVKQLHASTSTAKIPVIMVSSEQERDRKIEAADAGIVAWLSKPFTAETLLTLVRDVVRSRKRAAGDRASF